MNAQPDMPNLPNLPPSPPGALSTTRLIYGLHGVSVLVGLVSSVTVAGGFVFGLPSLVAVIINYVQRSTVQGCWLESHFRWQIRTFWLTFFGLLVYGLLCLTLILIPLAWVWIGLLGLWVIYRVVRGWLRLQAGQAMPV